MKEIDGESYADNQSFSSCILDNCLEYYARDYSTPIEGKLYDYSKYRYGIEIYPHNFESSISLLKNNNWVDNYTRRILFSSYYSWMHSYRFWKANISSNYIPLWAYKSKSNKQKYTHIIIWIKVSHYYSNRASFLVLNTLLVIVSIFYIMRSINEIYIGFHFFLNVIIMANNIGVLVNYIIYLIV